MAPAQSTLYQRLETRARALGFDAFAVADARAPWQSGDRLQEFLALGRHGEMTWMEETKDRRIHPNALWDKAQSAIVLGMNYGPDFNPLSLLAEKGNGIVSVYAARRDYHDVIKGRLKELAQWVARETKDDVKVFVDTAPLMEKPLAARAGIGWQGKHTNLVSRQFGSWLLLGTILTATRIAANAPETDHCGQCRACLDTCPTNAFPAPYQLDARRCIAYLTIEHAGPIPSEFRAAIGNRVFGCDDCLAVCPWNKFASVARETKLALRSELNSTALGELVTLDDQAFRARFAGTPVKRTGHVRFLRNVLIAIGNSGDAGLVGAAMSRLDAPWPLVRGAAIWALRQLLDPNAFARLKGERLAAEADSAVREEWA